MTIKEILIAKNDRKTLVKLAMIKMEVDKTKWDKLVKSTPKREEG